MSDQRVCCIAYLVNNLWKLRDAYHAFTQTTQVEILCIDIKLLKMFIQNHNLPVLHPKMLQIISKSAKQTEKSTKIRGTQRQFLENIYSEDDLRSRIFGTFS